MQVGQCEESQERERESEERSEKREERESQRRKKRHVGWKGGKVAKCTVVFTMIRGEGRKVGLIERGARSLQARSVVKKVKAFFNDFEVKSIKNSRSTFGNSISKKSQRLVFLRFAMKSGKNWRWWANLCKGCDVETDIYLQIVLRHIFANLRHIFVQGLKYLSAHFFCGQRYTSR